VFLAALLPTRNNNVFMAPEVPKKIKQKAGGIVLFAAKGPKKGHKKRPQKKGNKKRQQKKATKKGHKQPEVLL
jgi:hypothetical protein